MMERTEILKGLKPYFGIREFVCDHTYARFKDASWQFLHSPLLETVLVLRTKIICRPMVINHGTARQRGLRCNLCPLVKEKKTVYLTAHGLGDAIDFDVPGMTAEEVRTLIKEKADLLPYPIRLEKGVSWVHLDVLQQWGVTAKVYEFCV